MAVVVPWRAEFVKKLRRLFARFRSGEFTFDRKDVLSKPRKQLAFATGDSGILWQVSVAIDQARENRD